MSNQTANKTEIRLTVPPLLTEQPQPEDVYYNLPPCDVEGAVELLRFLREEDDAEEQRETFEYLRRVLDEDRFSERKIFQ